MSILFLLKLMADLLEGDTITKEKLFCVQKIVNHLIELCKSEPPVIISGPGPSIIGLKDLELDDEARKAQEELMQ